MVLWAGRFSKEIDKHVNDFNSSISFDNRMYAQDIRGSIAHATMLARQGIISDEDKEAITAGLTGILKDIESGDLAFDPNAEDIHMFIEAELTERIGDAGKRLHTARSRNDQVALDMKLYFHDEIGQILPLCRELIEVLLEKAAAHTETVMPGYTHLQRAPAHYLCPPSDGLCSDVFTGYPATARLRQAHFGHHAVRLRRGLRHHLSH